jgi:hypothetical protein
MQKFRILSADSSDALQKQVNAYLNEGWELQGTIIVFQEANGNKLLQAMIKG